MTYDRGDLALGRFRRRAVRVHRPCARGAADPGFRRWLAGADQPAWDRLNGWLALLHAEFDAGLQLARIIVISPELTDYERYLCTWHFVHTARAGEDVRIVDLLEADAHHDLPDHDFWFVDDRRAVRLFHDGTGRLERAEPVERAAVAGYRRAVAAAELVAEPFEGWWERIGGDALARHQPIPRVA